MGLSVGVIVVVVFRFTVFLTERIDIGVTLSR